MSYTEYEEEGWFSRIADSIKGIIGGLAMFFLAIPVLFMSETCAVDTAQDLELGLGSVVKTSADKVDKGNEGKLVHLTGKVDVKETLTDNVFNVTVDNALVLERNVEVYQWKEKKKTKTKKKAGGKKEKVTTYTYEKEWVSQPINSQDFKDEKYRGANMNSTLPYEDATEKAKSAKLGAYKLSENIVGSLGEYEDVTVTEEILAKAPKELQGKAKVQGGNFYLGPDPAQPMIGDVRISFKAKKPGATSTVIAGQYGDKLEEWKHEDLNDGLLLTAEGEKSPKQMFADAQEANTIKTWIFRILTYLMMVGGLALVFKPLSVVADVIPLIGDLVETASGIVAALIGTPIWLLTFALAWVFARPLLGIGMLAFAGLCIGGLVYFAMKKKKESGGPAPA